LVGRAFKLGSDFAISRKMPFGLSSSNSQRKLPKSRLKGEYALSIFRIMTAATCSIGFTLTQLCSSALSQSSPSPSPSKEMIQQSMNHRVQITVPRNADTRADRKLTRLEDIPDVPPYSGKKEIVDGHELSGDGHIAYRFKFYVKEKPDEVIQWYSKALGMYNWKTVDQTETDMTVKNKQGVLFTANAQRTLRKDFNTVVKLYYTQNSQK
jgi:hypothetical protein